MTKYEDISPRIRVFVWLFIGSFVLAGFLRIEAWPLTGWRLFSHARRQVQTSWQAVTVDGSGGEHALPLGRLGQAYRGTTHVLAEFDELPDRRRLAACEAWARGAARFGAQVTEVRVYRVVRDVGDRRGDRGAPPRSRDLRYTCRDGRVEARAT